MNKDNRSGANIKYSAMSSSVGVTLNYISWASTRTTTMTSFI